MAFFKKKEEELPSDIDLDVPPEPPKMLGEESSTEGPIDEELMPPAKIMKSKAKSRDEELPELPPLPEMEEELPPLPEVEEKKHEELELPPPPEVKPKKKGLFPFLKRKKAAKEAPLPEGLPELPPLPEVGKEEMPPLPGEEKEFHLPEVEEKEFPEIPPIPKEEKKLPPLPEIEEKELFPIPEKKPFAPPMELLEPEVKMPEPLKPRLEKAVPKVEGIKPELKFITLDDFKQIHNEMSNTKSILRGVDGFLTKLEEVKNNADKGYLELHNDLREIHRKIMFVDETLFKKQSV